MNLLYNIAIYGADFFLKILAIFNEKINLGVKGRAKTFHVLKNQWNAEQPTFWFHCASLGEYEQGLPIFKELRSENPNHQIVLTFFSPSGYEIRKNTPVADVVVYLPMDTKANAEKFVSLINPELTIFVKYEIWPNYLNELKRRHLKAILISATFRQEQSYFKWYGSLMRNALKTFTHIFVQDEQSKNLLDSGNFRNVTISGDTRYDRVSDQLLQDNKLPYIKEFIDGKLCVVLGSSWPEDEILFIDYINSAEADKVKFIIAPHNIKKNQIQNFSNQIDKKMVLFSGKENKELSEFSVFIIDTIGLLSKIYSYADIAFVGGAMGTTGLHNILEPAVFGAPIIIGKNHTKFPEASAMIANGGVHSVEDRSELETVLNALVNNSVTRHRLGQLNAEFIIKNKGAVHQIMDYIRNSG